MGGRRTYRARGIVLLRTALSEKDYIITLLLESGEKLQAVAKGARRPGGKLAARVELFCESDFLLAEGRNLDVITEASIREAHLGLTDFERAAAAAAIAEIARLSCFEESEDAFLYPVLARAFTALEEAPDRARMDVVLAAYAMKILAHGGWRPQLSSCIMCGDEQPLHFSAVAGGALCASCSQTLEGALPVTPSQLAWIGSLVSKTFDELLAEGVDEETGVFLAGMAHAWAATHLDARLKSFEFYMGA